MMYQATTPSTQRSLPTEAAVTIIAAHRHCDGHRASLRLRCPASSRPADQGWAARPVCSIAWVLEYPAGWLSALRLEACEPVFSSRSSVTNCCGRKYLEGTL